jgi:hypothetical protein
MTYNQAVVACKQQGAHVVVPSSPNEQFVVDAIVAEHGMCTPLAALCGNGPLPSRCPLAACCVQ